jgi:hypothetical protein
LDYNSIFPAFCKVFSRDFFSKISTDEIADEWSLSQQKNPVVLSINPKKEKTL